MTAPALELIDIHKRYGAVAALRGASLSVAPGEIHALLGENGAGKSTLMQVAFGMVRPDAGTVRIGGAPRPPRSPRDARRMGAGMVHQHPTSVPSLPVWENVALAAGWSVRPDQCRRMLLRLSESAGLPLDPDAYAGRLPIALKQRLEIVKALAGQARLLLLDEPTAVLAPSEAEELLDAVRRYVAAGNAVVLITHKLPEALALSDRVTVLRHGAVTLSGRTGEQTADALAVAMLGAPAGAPAARDAPAPGATLVRADALDIAREGRYGLAVRNAAFSVRAGEVVGVAAVEGGGQRELLRAVAGLLPAFRGVLEVRGPVAFIPEDRTTEGLIPEMSLTENVVLGLGEKGPGVSGRWSLSWREARAGTSLLLQRAGVVAAGPSAAAATLSGGNQQKLVVARALALGPAVLVAENPTRGLDIGAAAAVHSRIRAVAGAGAGVLAYSSDLDEVMERSDRILVVTAGTVRAAPAGASRELVGRMMVGAA